MRAKRNNKSHELLKEERRSAMVILKGECILIQSCRKIPASVQEIDFQKVRQF